MSKINPDAAQAPQKTAMPEDKQTSPPAQDKELAALQTALTETRLLGHQRQTEILEAQVEIRVLEGARDAAHAQLETARAEVLTLTRLLAQSEPRAGGDLAPETFARTLDRQAQQLEAQTREMAELTRLLARSEQETRALQKARTRMITWLPELMEALLQGPGAADPAAEGARLQDADFAECARRLLATGAFDAEYYLTTNPDVADSGTDPARHFVQYGLTEGRAPRDLTQPRHCPVAETPMAEGTPEPDASEADLPETEAPETDIPEADRSEADIPELQADAPAEIPAADPAEAPDDRAAALEPAEEPGADPVEERAEERVLAPDSAAPAGPEGADAPRAAAPDLADSPHGRS
ncbi:hypothetical protein [Dinoroseobacter sp. S76]|uniref:hypothetical protein n=1 Tax=Dinoroseobacter sp. S76 TaxID=3415124 RepID=UPI003C79ADCB